MLRFFVKLNAHTPLKVKKMEDFAASNKLIIANQLLLTNLERFIRRIKSPLTRSNISRFNSPKLAKMAKIKPP